MDGAVLTRLRDLACAEVDTVDPDRDYRAHDLRADLLLPDGSEVKAVPYHDQCADDGSSWCRPFIASIRVR